MSVETADRLNKKNRPNSASNITKACGQTKCIIKAADAAAPDAYAKNAVRKITLQMENN
jgi:methyl coenzyme M reductase alpha subunit